MSLLCTKKVTSDLFTTKGTILQALLMKSMGVLPEYGMSKDCSI